MVTQDPFNIAFIALSVSGQLNVHLATIEHMLSLSPSESPPLHFHLISFEPAAKRAHALAASHSSGPSTVNGTANTSRNTLTFHSLGPLSLFTSISANGLIDRHGPASLFARGGLKSYRFLAELFGFNPELYVGVYEHILAIFKEMGRVDVAIVDLTMPIGMDACQTAGVRWGILCPNSGLELSKFDQPRLRGFWKFPAYVHHDQYHTQTILTLSEHVGRTRTSPTPLRYISSRTTSRSILPGSAPSRRIRA